MKLSDMIADTVEDIRKLQSQANVPGLSEPSLGEILGRLTVQRERFLALTRANEMAIIGQIVECTADGMTFRSKVLDVVKTPDENLCIVVGPDFVKFALKESELRPVLEASR
jgi:hypothetical protein